MDLWLSSRLFESGNLLGEKVNDSANKVKFLWAEQRNCNSGPARYGEAQERPENKKRKGKHPCIEVRRNRERIFWIKIHWRKIRVWSSSSFSLAANESSLLLSGREKVVLPPAGLHKRWRGSCTRVLPAWLPNSNFELDFLNTFSLTHVPFLIKILLQKHRWSKRGSSVPY